MHRIVPFTDDHVVGAAELLAARHRRLRAGEPALGEKYGAPETVRSIVESAAAVEGAHALAAVADGRLVGFLVGQPQDGFFWGRAAWVDLEGHATTDPALTVDLYAAWARHWVDRGAFHHYVTVPVGEPDQLDIWFQLGFGQMQAYALRGTNTADLPLTPGVQVREATAADADFIAAVANVINAAQLDSPSFTPLPAEHHELTVAQYLEELRTGPDPWWVAVDATTGEPLGLSMSYDADDALHTPPGAVYLGGTLTAPTAVRRGVARALLRHTLDRAAARGVGHCTTNWRTSNPSAARTWPALGFRRTHIRLARRIDDRVAWATGPVRDRDPGAFRAAP